MRYDYDSSLNLEHSNTHTHTMQASRLQNEISHLETENKMFEHYMNKHVEEYELSQSEKQNAKNRRRLSSMRNNATSNNSKPVPTALSVNQKLKISSTIMNDTMQEIEASKARDEKLLQTLMAVLEETDVRIAELRKEAYEFKRDVVVGAENPRTGKIMAEKVIRYIEDNLRRKDAIIEKIKLKNASMKSHIKRLQQQLKDKEEMGDVLHYIDFHQLQIENKQNVATIEEKNMAVLKIKTSTGHIVQTLNDKKKELIQTETEIEWLNGESNSKTCLLKKIEEETERIRRDIERTRESKQSSAGDDGEADQTLHSTSNSLVARPKLMQYIQQKAEMYELGDEIKNWERKIEIASISLSPEEMEALNAVS
jgi:hypothetical protein